MTQPRSVPSKAMTSVTATAADTRSLLRMPTPARTSRPGNRTVLAGLVAALVLGILGMHALATHGTPAAATAPAASTTMNGMRSTSATGAHDAAMASGSSHRAHAHPTAGVQSSPAANADGKPADSSHHMNTMVMLCVVMLAAAALNLLALLAVRLLRPLLPAAFKPAPTPERTMRWVLGAGPPPAWKFSVVRC